MKDFERTGQTKLVTVCLMLALDCLIKLGGASWEMRSQSNLGQLKTFILNDVRQALMLSGFWSWK